MLKLKLLLSNPCAEKSVEILFLQVYYLLDKLNLAFEKLLNKNSKFRENNYETSGLYIILSAMAFAVSAQTSDSPIEVIQQKWHFILRNPALDEDPFRAINEQKQIEAEKLETIRENKIRAKNGQPQELPPVHLRNSAELNPLPASTIFIYELKIRNAGQKSIKNLSWDYVFLDKDGKTEIGRRQFLSNSNIRAGETKKLTAKSTHLRPE